MHLHGQIPERGDDGYGTNELRGGIEPILDDGVAVQDILDVGCDLGIRQREMRADDEPSGSPAAVGPIDKLRWSLCHVNPITDTQIQDAKQTIANHPRDMIAHLLRRRRDDHDRTVRRS